MLRADAVNEPFVTCEISGQLGNQLFQIANTLAYAWDYHAQSIFPELNKSEWNISTNRDRVFYPCDSKDLEGFM